jgi:hypothetical protein
MHIGSREVVTNLQATIVPLFKSPILPILVPNTLKVEIDGIVSVVIEDVESPIIAFLDGMETKHGCIVGFH